MLSNTFIRFAKSYESESVRWFMSSHQKFSRHFLFSFFKFFHRICTLMYTKEWQKSLFVICFVLVLFPRVNFPCEFRWNETLKCNSFFLSLHFISSNCRETFLVFRICIYMYICFTVMLFVIHSNLYVLYRHFCWAKKINNNRRKWMQNNREIKKSNARHDIE